MFFFFFKSQFVEVKKKYSTFGFSFMATIQVDIMYDQIVKGTIIKT